MERQVLASHVVRVQLGLRTRWTIPMVSGVAVVSIAALIGCSTDYEAIASDTEFDSADSGAENASDADTLTITWADGASLDASDASTHELDANTTKTGGKVTGTAPAPDACTKANGFCTYTLQCDNGHWINRQDDRTPCTTIENVQEPCAKNNDYCTATLQCDNGHWVPRPDDPTKCTSGPGEE